MNCNSGGTWTNKPSCNGEIFTDFFIQSNIIRDLHFDTFIIISALCPISLIGQLLKGTVINYHRWGATNKWYGINRGSMTPYQRGCGINEPLP